MLKKFKIVLSIILVALYLFIEISNAIPSWNEFNIVDSLLVVSIGFTPFHQDNYFINLLRGLVTLVPLALYVLNLFFVAKNKKAVNLTFSIFILASSFIYAIAYDNYFYVPHFLFLTSIAYFVLTIISMKNKKVKEA